MFLYKGFDMYQNPDYFPAVMRGICHEPLSEDVSGKIGVRGGISPMSGEKMDVRGRPPPSPASGPGVSPGTDHVYLQDTVAGVADIIFRGPAG
jgi:hypothetical protein